MPGLAREIRVKRQRGELVISTRAASARGGTIRLGTITIPSNRLEDSLRNPDLWEMLGLAVKTTIDR